MFATFVKHSGVALAETLFGVVTVVVCVAVTVVCGGPALREELVRRTVRTLHECAFARRVEKRETLKIRSDADAAKRLGTWVDGLEFSLGERILGVDVAIAGQ